MINHQILENLNAEENPIKLVLFKENRKIIKTKRGREAKMV